MILAGDIATREKHGRLVYYNDTILANLEGPVLPFDHEFVPKIKAGPNIFSINLPVDNNRYAFALANNHIMDYGLQGLEHTLSLLNHKNFKGAGAGKNINEAQRPIVVEDNDIRIGIISCCEAQFGMVTCNHAGVAEIGPWIYRTIDDLKSEVNAVVVSAHAAVEDSPWPSPRIQHLYRSFIHSGATIVHAHHSHIPQGCEEYEDGIIFYGLGNFMVDPNKWRDIPNSLWSLGAKIDFKTKPVQSSILTFEIREGDGNEIYVEESTEPERIEHKKYLKKCCYPLSNSELMEALWQEVSLRAYFHYGARYLGFSNSVHRKPTVGERLNTIKEGGVKIAKGIAGIKKKSQLSKYDYLLRHVMFACESHRQMLATALGILAGEIEDLRTEETLALADEMMPWSVGVVEI